MRVLHVQDHAGPYVHRNEICVYFGIWADASFLALENEIHQAERDNRDNDERHLLIEFRRAFIRQKERYRVKYNYYN
jgi:hypothetical protein